MGIIFGFLSDRSHRVKLDQKLSDRVHLRWLGPLLYILLDDFHPGEGKLKSDAIHRGPHHLLVHRQQNHSQYLENQGHGYQFL